MVGLLCKTEKNLLFSAESYGRVFIEIARKPDFMAVAAILNNQQACIGRYAAQRFGIHDDL